MKIAILLTVAVVSIAQAGGQVVLTTNCYTNHSGRVRTVNVYTRGGQTNLVIGTDRQDDDMTGRNQSVYRNGKVVFWILEGRRGVTCATEPNSDCRIETVFTSNGQLYGVCLTDAHQMFLDHFTANNGVLRPTSSADIDEMNRLEKQGRARLHNQAVVDNSGPRRASHPHR
jgi:hypothetical protein